MTRLRSPHHIKLYKDKKDIVNTPIEPVSENIFKEPHITIGRSDQMIIHNYKDWIHFMARTFSLDTSTWKVYEIAALKWHEQAKSSYIFLDQTEIMELSGLSRSTVSLSLRTMCFCRMIWPMKGERGFYYVNTLFFKPSNQLNIKHIIFPKGDYIDSLDI